MQSIKKKTEGFTIIEVMIVLVIAAVILLIVFLAVPALQRNSRNNQRNNDVARISAAVTEYANNNQGTLPTSSGQVESYIGDLGFYDVDDQVIITGTATQSALNNENQVRVVTGAQCNGAATVSGTSRTFAVQYAVETGGDAEPQCLEG